LANAVADGTAIDWTGVERRYRNHPENSAVFNLRLLHELGVDRKPSASSPRLSASLSLALRLLFGLAGLQVLLANAIFAFSATDSKPISGSLVITVTLVFAVAALVLLTAGARDRRTLPLAGAFLCVSAATAQRFLPQIATLAPWFPSGWLKAFLPEAFLPAFLWVFTRDFPRVVRFSRWSRALEPMIWVSAGVGAFLFAGNAYAQLSGLGEGTAYMLLRPFLRRSTGTYWTALSILTLLAPCLSVLRQTSASGDERRRVRAFVTGLAIGIVPLFAQVLAENLIPAYDRLTDVPRWQALSGGILYAFLLSVPVTTTYAVVARRVLDVRLTLGLAARLALARGSLAILAASPILLLVYQAYRHRDLPLAVVFSRSESRGWFLASLCGVALLLFRAPMLRIVERRLLGRMVTAGFALAKFGQEAQRAGGIAILLQLLRRELSGFLRCETVTLLIRESSTSLLSDPEGWTNSLATDTSLVLMAEASSSPIFVDPEGRTSLYSWLPEPERKWVEESGLYLLIPLATMDGALRGLLCVGPARTGARYSQDELSGVTAFASTTALTLERLSHEGSRLAEGSTELRNLPAGECTRCGCVVESANDRCRCGGILVPAPLPYVLHGKFRIEQILGRGGMGVVYRATDLVLGRIVALKTLPRLEINALQRLQREARSMASVVHPGLATIFGVETWRGVPVLVVECLEGGTLSRRLKGPMDPRTAVELCIDLAAALVAMHSRDLLHRDLKPSNIGFTDDGKPKLLDFGLARLFEEAGGLPERPARSGLRPEGDEALCLTLSRHIVGTPLYLSPEALAGVPASPSQDVWALFITLWETVAGRHPLHGKSFPDAMRALANAEIPDVREARPDCPLSLVALLNSAFDPRPDRRPATAEVARQKLLGLIHGLA